ncbi:MULTISPECIES: hypothetical protein [Streptomyces]|uniref:Uncharacterized protein n=1 Tax=Streptomyces pratisoli TaxID=3139917 RepID=A0ACC6QGP0_9ACTN|nr:MULTISPECIES: hypothetical protein [unclassified Streptomyces]MCX4508841.1 hypothetical protein [Streptomyces sp. NBC_01619]
MQRLKLKAAALVYAAASLAVAVVPASASASTAQEPRGDVVVIDCFSKPQVRPSDFLIACGDGNSGLTQLKWTNWGQTTATGRGLNFVNDCKPYCAAGKFHSYPVEVTLEQPKPWPKDPGQQRYTQMRLVFTDGRPAHLAEDVTYKLWP